MLRAGIAPRLKPAKPSPGPHQGGSKHEDAVPEAIETARRLQWFAQEAWLNLSRLGGRPCGERILARRKP